MIEGLSTHAQSEVKWVIGHVLWLVVSNCHV